MLYIENLHARAGEHDILKVKPPGGYHLAIRIASGAWAFA